MSTIVTHKLRIIQKNVYAIWCPGCQSEHVIPIHGADDVRGITARWSYDYNPTSPTFIPSIHITATGDWEDTGIEYRKTLCHFYIQCGNLVFLSDCSHKLAGLTISMVKFPDWDAV